VRVDRREDIRCTGALRELVRGSASAAKAVVSSLLPAAADLSDGHPGTARCWKRATEAVPEPAQELSGHFVVAAEDVRNTAATSIWWPPGAGGFLVSPVGDTVPELTASTSHPEGYPEDT